MPTASNQQPNFQKIDRLDYRDKNSLHPSTNTTKH